MEMIDLEKEVERAVGREWEAFAREHPRLAAAMDRRLLLERAAASLKEDPQFRAAMDRAAAVGTAAEAIGAAVRRFIGEFSGKPPA